MGQVKNFIKLWMNEIGDSPQNITNNIFIDEWTPKVKWFRPPLWKIFRWAYNHKYTKISNAYPSSINIETETNETVHNIEFVANDYSNPAVDQLANNLLNSFNNEKG